MNAIRLNFASGNRLHTAAEFSAVFANRRVLRGRHFDLHFRPKEVRAGATVGASLGLVVAKKLARRSVLRNLVKRIGREAFRHALPGLPDCELVLRLAKPLAQGDLSSRDARRAWRAEIDDLLERLPGELSR